MREIIHLSDLHIGAGPHRARVVQRLVAYILGIWAPNECLVLITGDLTEGTLNPLRQGRHWQQMDLARELLQPLVRAGYVLIVVPGNHDHSARGATIITARHVKEFRRRVLTPLQPWTATPWAPCWDDGEVCVVGADSTRGQLGADVDLARGCLGSDELRRIGRLLAETSARARGVAMHHNVDYDAWTNRLEDDEALLAVLEREGADYLWQGHEHRERWVRERRNVRTTFASWRTTDARAGRLAFAAFDPGTHTHTIHDVGSYQWASR